MGRLCVLGMLVMSACVSTRKSAAEAPCVADEVPPERADAYAEGMRRAAETRRRTVTECPELYRNPPDFEACEASVVQADLGEDMNRCADRLATDWRQRCQAVADAFALGEPHIRKSARLASEYAARACGPGDDGNRPRNGWCARHGIPTK